jgi:hypothetical protein
MCFRFAFLDIFHIPMLIRLEANDLFAKIFCRLAVARVSVISSESGQSLGQKEHLLLDGYSRFLGIRPHHGAAAGTDAVTVSSINEMPSQ